MWHFKRKNEKEKREFVKDAIREGLIKPENEEKAVKELLDCEIRIEKRN